MCHSVTERYLSLGSTLPSASRAKGDLLEPDEEAPVHDVLLLSKNDM